MMAADDSFNAAVTGLTKEQLALTLGPADQVSCDGEDDCSIVYELESPGRIQRLLIDWRYFVYIDVQDGMVRRIKLGD